MPGLNRSPLYRWAKGLWLLMQGLLLPLMVLYLTRESPGPTPSVLLRALLWAVGAFFLILWLMAHAVLSMARFPLTTRGALRLTLGHVFTFLVSWVLFGLPLFAAYITCVITLISLIICGFLLAPAAVKAGLTSRRTALWASLVLLAGAAGVAWLTGPLWRELSRLEWWQAGLSLSVMAGSVWSTVRGLWRVTTLGATADPESRAYDAEWERWAAPTIITLILSATAAIALGGISQAWGGGANW
jgi:hypothetical protein